MIGHRPAIAPAPPYASAREVELLAEVAAEREARTTAESVAGPMREALTTILLLAGSMDSGAAASEIEAARLRILEVAAAGCGVGTGGSRTGG